MRKILLILPFLIFTFFHTQAQLIAFPGAEGFGKFAKGARASGAPAIYRVTNLNDSGTGSFRDAVSASNRIVVFDVAGVIKISSRIVVASNIYIAGQTAPGEGITIYGNGFSFSGANNVICRYLRIRMGAVGDSGKDACGIANGSNMIFDHVSVSWGRDETFSISGESCINITIQNSIISQGLLSHSAGGLIQTDGGVTLYRNLYVDNDTRNNKIKGVNQYVNNLIYNWSSGAYIMGGDSEGESFANCESNYFINGPANSVAALSGANNKYHLYANDNWWDKNRNGNADGYLVPQSEYSGGPDFQATPYNYPVLPKWSATTLVDSVLPAVGASLPYRDLADCYVVNEVKSFGKKGKFISNENELSIGTPSEWAFWTGTKRTDADGDGIPDVWESAHGLNPNVSSDAVLVAANGYLNIENYINSITNKESQDFLRAPLNLTTDSITQNDVFLTWFDFTDREGGYCIEQKINGTFTEIARTTINGNVFTLKGLNPEQFVTMRVRAFNTSGYSGYSNELTVKTKPVPVAVVNLQTFTPDLTWNGQQSSNWDKSTANWTGAAGQGTFTDQSKVLFSGGNTQTNIQITEAVLAGTIVVNADSDYSFKGSPIGGPASVNKTGIGKLSLLSDNTYTGATVLHQGILEINKLANGGITSAIGASQNYDFNLVLKGGKLNYTGASVSTDRSINIENNPEVSVGTSGSILTLNGLITGTGNLIKSGAGTLLCKGINTYSGTTTINEGTLEYNGIDNINSNLGAGKSFVLNGGKLKTSGGSTTDYENYYAAIQVADGKTSSFEPYRNCYIYSKVSGNGTLNFNIPYVREYIQGDWSQFSGTLNANGTGSATDGSQFMLNNTTGIRNGRIVTSGNTKIVCWKNASTMYLGGLSGPTGTWLSGADKQNNAAVMTWIVGGAGTNETFNGIINNECSNKSYKGTVNIVKEGNGFWRLTGNNIYNGTTTIKDGMLIINGIQAGTGKVTVMEEATLAGKGTIPANIEVQSGGILNPGDPGGGTTNIATLTIGSLNLSTESQTHVEISKTAGLSDKVAATGAIVLAGKLHISQLGSAKPIAGDQFTLFTGSTITGTFSEIIPATPGENLAWSMTGGILKVITAVNALNNIDSEKITIYPNPASSKTTLTLPEVYKKISINIIGTDGKTRQTTTFRHTDRIELLFSDINKGSYLIQIKCDNKQIATRKLILK